MRKIKVQAEIILQVEQSPKTDKWSGTGIAFAAEVKLNESVQALDTRAGQLGIRFHFKDVKES